MSQASTIIDDAQRDGAIDLLRGISILLIIILHVFVMTPYFTDLHKWIQSLVHQLGMGVPFFFVLSGCVIAGAYERSIARPEGWRGFYIRRAAKIVPLYIIFLHLGILAYLFLPQGHGFRNGITNENLTWSNYVSHLFFVQGISPIWLHSLLDGSWSIVCEVYFYVLFPILFYRYSKTAGSALALYALAIVVSIGFSLAVSRGMGSFAYYSFPAHLPCFLLGVYCYRIMNNSVSVELAGAHKIALLVTIVLLFFGCSKAEVVPLGGHHLMTLLFAAALVFAPVRSNALPFEVLRWFGRQSYSLYFVHLLMLHSAYSLMQFSFPFGEGLWLLINFGLTLIIGTLLSLMVFNRIDQWFVEYVSKWLKSVNDSSVFGTDLRPPSPNPGQARKL